MESNAKAIRDVLLTIGIPTNLIGFSHLSYIEELLLQNSEYTGRVSKIIYIDVAKKYNTTPACVERCIRHAIAVGWRNGNAADKERIFKNSMGSRNVPTNTQFISAVYFHLMDRPV